MKKIILAALICIAGFAATAQKTVLKNGKLAPNVPTKTLKKLITTNFQRKSYKNVMLVADTILKRNPADKETRQKRMVSAIFLKMDQKAIADIKQYERNKDSAATLLATVPSSFDGMSSDRGFIYTRTAMAYAPKNGIPCIMHAAMLADAGKFSEALTFSEKGWKLLNDDYKESFLPIYALVKHISGEKESAYELLEAYISKPDVNNAVIEQYFNLFVKDKRLEEGIAKAGELYNSEKNISFIVERSRLHYKAGYNDKACEDASMVKAETGNDFYLVEYECTEVMADAKPSPARTYVYKVNFNDRDYDFRVSNSVVDMNKGASFRYKMTGENSITGKVKISPEALATAHDQNNTFSDGDLDLTDKTTVWVSKAVYKELKENGTALLGADPWGAKEYSVVDDGWQDSRYYRVNVDGESKYVKCLKLASEDGQLIWIADDPTNPIILKMDVSFSIELLEII